jgi:hypothetical protein
VGQLGIVEAWHDAVNAGAAASAGALCTEDVEVGGPKGSAHGRGMLVDWVRHAGIRMEPVRWYCGAAGAVVEQDARWLDRETGELGAPVRVATVFGFTGDRISRVLRYPDGSAAIAALGLGPANEVTRRGNGPRSEILSE